MGTIIETRDRAPGKLRGATKHRAEVSPEIEAGRDGDK
jgi:hypothetical protein